MNAFLTILFLALPFLLLVGLIAFLIVSIGSRTKQTK